MIKHFNLFAGSIGVAMLLSASVARAQPSRICGVYTDAEKSIRVSFNPDSTFRYTSTSLHPTFSRFESFEENGRWIQTGDTVILNPSLDQKPFIESQLIEQSNAQADRIGLTFNHVRRFYDKDGNLEKSDTTNIERLDFAFNSWQKHRRTRVTAHRSSRCTFAGYIPKEIVTNNRTVTFDRPAEKISSIIVGCYELTGIRSFKIANAASNHFTLNIFSNYYADGQLRRVKFLAGTPNILYTRQKSNGEFEKDNVWSITSFKIKKDLRSGE